MSANQPGKKEYLKVDKTPQIKRVNRIGLIVLIGFLGGFLLWAAVFPLESAAVAKGYVVVQSNRKTIQHLEGGIVKQIYVKEGDVVKEGDNLIQLDQTQTTANLDIVKGQSDLLLARKAWLQALADNKDKVVFPERLISQANNPDIKKIMDDATALFKSKHDALVDGVNILNFRKQQLQSEIDSIKAQLTSADKQLGLINEEMNAVISLESEGYVDKPRLMLLKREAAKLEGDKGEKQGLIAQNEQKISETDLQIVSLKDNLQNDTLKQLEDTDLELVANLEKEVTMEDISKRSMITAPIAGKVLNLREHTIGGVIGPREPIMDIVPDQDKLVIEARLSPQDIDVVHVGLPAKVRLTAYKQRKTPTIDGVVTLVSADVDRDEKTGDTYYLVRVAVDPNELAALPDVTLYPGMPAQVNIIVAKRTPLEYLLTPITDSFSRAFREK